jgi:hypothetical protein
LNRFQVPGPVRADVDVLAGGGVDECGADPGSKVSPAKEPGDVADVGEDPRVTGRADARDVRGSLRTGATKVMGQKASQRHCRVCSQE